MALSGTDASEFVSMAAFQAAVDRILSMRRTRLTEADAERLFASLDREERVERGHADTRTPSRPRG